MDQNLCITVGSAEDGTLRTLPIVYSCPVIPVKVTTPHQYKTILPGHIVNVADTVNVKEPEIELISLNPHQRDSGEELDPAFDSSPAHLDHNYCLRIEPPRSEFDPFMVTFNENKDFSNLPAGSFSDKSIFLYFYIMLRVQFFAVVAVARREKVERIKNKYRKRKSIGKANKRCKVPNCNNNDRDNPEMRFFFLSTIPVNREMFNIRLELAYPKLKINCRLAKGYVCQEHYYVSTQITFF
jgi:hypothetical protein